MRKGFYLAICTLTVLGYCSAEAALVDSKQTNTNLVPTPYGLRPAQCVHAHPSGTTLRETPNGVEAVTPQGLVKNFPILKECIEYDKRWKAKHLKKIRQSKLGIKPADGWLDNASWFPPNPVTSVSGNYIVPNDPAAGKLTYWLYYFLGTENFQSNVGVTILQPVLSWTSSGWNITSSECCPGGQVHNANEIPASANSTVVGSITQQGDTWVVDSISGTQHSTLQVATDNRIFNWTDATLETYGALDCTYFPTNPIQFSQIVIGTTAGTALPQWSATGTTECNGKTTIISPSDITIQHNGVSGCVPANPTITYSPNTTQTIQQNASVTINFQITNNDSAACLGSNFALTTSTNSSLINSALSNASFALAPQGTATGYMIIKSSNVAVIGQAYSATATLTDAANNRATSFTSQVLIGNPLHK